MGEGEVLFEAQSIGYEFFIILGGSVSICINVKGNDHEERLKQLMDSGPAPVRSSETPKRHKSAFEGVPRSPPNVLSRVFKNTEGYHVIHDGVLTKQINTIHAGASFGEVAIMGKDTCTRNATILCVKDCDFIVLDKSNFQRIIGEHKEREVNAKVQLLKKSRVFTFIPDRSLSTLIYFLQPRSFKYREIILRQQEVMKEIIIVRRGQVKAGEV